VGGRAGSRIRLTTMSRRNALATAAFALVTAVAGSSGSAAADPAAAPGDPQGEAGQAQIAQLRPDWAQLLHYRDENRSLPPPNPAAPRVIFLGDSITQSWNLADLGLGRLEVLNRGISGQTTPQMLVRFRQDVVNLRPALVHILAGTNDLAENTGPTTLDAIEDNLRSMVEIAEVNHIRVALASVLPTVDYPWRRGLQPAQKIIALNDWMRAYARRRKLVYVDYYSALVDSRGGFKSALAEDGVHPNPAGYAAMSTIARDAIVRSLGRHVSAARQRERRASARVPQWIGLLS
jgi:acyl-CoA thioesterase I